MCCQCTANAQNGLSVVESAGNVVAKVAKVKNAQTARSDVESQPELKVAEAVAKAEDAQNELSVVESAGNVVALWLLRLRRLKMHRLRVLM